MTVVSTSLISVSSASLKSVCPLCQEEDDTNVYLIAQCSALNASLKRYPWSFHCFIGYAEWHPLASAPEVRQSFKEVPSTLRSVGDTHWALAVASALGVCLAGIHPEGKVRQGKVRPV